MIEQSVPVWKREHRDDGARWVDARQGHDESWAATPEPASSASSSALCSG